MKLKLLSNNTSRCPKSFSVSLIYWESKSIVKQEMKTLDALKNLQLPSNRFSRPIRGDLINARNHHRWTGWNLSQFSSASESICLEQLILRVLLRVSARSFILFRAYSSWFACILVLDAFPIWNFEYMSNLNWEGIYLKFLNPIKPGI